MKAGLACLAALLFLPGLVRADPFQHASGEWREYHRDWLAACPDRINEDADQFQGYSCFASTGSEESNSANLPAYKLTIVRNRLNGDLDLAITVADDDLSIDMAGTLALGFTGEPTERFDFVNDLEIRHNTINQFFVVDPDRKLALLDKMKQRNAIELMVPVAGGESRRIRLSLRGVLASMDFMATYARRVSQY